MMVRLNPTVPPVTSHTCVFPYPVLQQNRYYEAAKGRFITRFAKNYVYIFNNNNNNTNMGACVALLK